MAIVNPIRRAWLAPALGLAALCAAAGGLTTDAHAVALSGIELGALGDSYTFPYDERSSRNRHRSWAEQLDAFYSSDNIFGPGTNPAYNVAQSGYTTSQMATTEISDFGSNIVQPEAFVLFAGVNDFSGAFNTANGGSNIPLNDIPAVADSALANIQQTVQNVRDARDNFNPSAPDPDFVIINTIDRGSWPLLDPMNQAGNAPEVFAAVTAATDTLNDNLTDWALGQGIPVVDAHGLLALGNELDQGGSLTIAGQSIAAGTTATDQPGNSWYADAAHAGTIYHGLLANAVLEALDLRHDITSPRLDAHDDILTTAYDENAWPTQGSQSLSDYLNSLDEDLYAIDGTPFDYDPLDYVAAFLSGDLNGDGFVSQADLDLVLLNWGDGVFPTGWAAAEQFSGGQISQDELDAVLLNWGTGTPAPGSTPSLTAVPEPSGAVLLSGLALLGVRRRSERSGE